MQKPKLTYTQTTGTYLSALAQAIHITDGVITILAGDTIITAGDTLLITMASLTSDGTIPIMDGATQVITTGIHRITITDITTITEIILRALAEEDLHTLVL